MPLSIRPSRERFAAMRRSVDSQLIVIILVASIARLIQPGAYPLLWDESRILNDAMMLARHGRWIWLTANQAGWILPGHSPFTDYLLAIPYLFTTDPIVIRLLVGVLGVIAVALVYVTTKRYFGQTAATIAGLLLAVSAQAVEYSRFVWNPNIAPAFIALTILTGLLGYYEGKRWAQILHWIALSLAIQAHPGNALLAPLSILLVVIYWFRCPAERRVLLRNTGIGWLLLVLSVIPFAIGIASSTSAQRMAAQAADSAERRGATPSLGDVVGTFSDLVASTNYSSISRTKASSSNWWPDWSTDTILRGQLLIAAVGALWLLVQGVRDPRNKLPGLYLALLSLFPLLSLELGPFKVSTFYLMAILFAAYPVQGIVLARLFRQSKWAAILVCVLVAAFAGMQVWLVAANVHWLTTEGTLEAFRAPMTLHQDLLKNWLSDAKEVVILTETVEGKYGPTEQERLWSVETEGYPVRVLRMPQGIPIAADGEVVVGTYKGQAIPDYFGQGQIAGRLSNGDPIFRWVLVTPDQVPQPNVTPQGAASFANGARIVGISAPTGPQAGRAWPITLIWQPQKTYTSEQYQFSVRLVDDKNNVYGQYDMASLAGSAWRTGDTVLNRMLLPVKDTLPTSPLMVQIVMYSWPEIRNVDVVDEAGNAVSPWMTLSLGSR